MLENVLSHLGYLFSRHSLHPTTIKVKGQLCKDTGVSPSNQHDYEHESKVSKTGISDINIYGYITIDSRSRKGKTFNDGNSARVEL